MTVNEKDLGEPTATVSEGTGAAPLMAISSDTDDSSSPSDALRAEVNEVMKGLLGVEEIRTDADGDVPVRCGDVAIYVRVVPEARTVQVFSPVVAELETRADVYRILNEINSVSPFIRGYLDGGTVVFSAEVVGNPLAVTQLEVALEAVSCLANRWAGALLDRYGGRTAFGAPCSAPSVGHGGYL